MASALIRTRRSTALLQLDRLLTLLHAISCRAAGISHVGLVTADQIFRHDGIMRSVIGAYRR